MNESNLEKFRNVLMLTILVFMSLVVLLKVIVPIIEYYK